MSHFRSLQVQAEDPVAQPQVHPWPAFYRDFLPTSSREEAGLEIRIENQLPKVMDYKQLASLPSFRESRRIVSKAGWMYYGQWKGITFQTLFTMFSNPHLYPWVCLESLNGSRTMIERGALMNYRLLLECDGQALSPLYGGPIWLHCFDYYVEYAFPHVCRIVLMQGEHEYTHPSQAIGFTLEQARVVPGTYYAIHHQRITTL